MTVRWMFVTGAVSLVVACGEGEQSAQPAEAAMAAPGDQSTEPGGPPMGMNDPMGTDPAPSGDPNQGDGDPGAPPLDDPAMVDDSDPLPVDGAGGAPADDAQAGAGGQGDPAPPMLKPPEELEIAEYDIPDLPGCNNSFPHDPAVDEATGLVYYADSNNSCIGEFNPETMEFRAWPTPTPDSYPHGLVVVDGSRVAYTGADADTIGVLDPKAGTIEDYPVDANRPHTPTWHQGKVWFTAQNGGQYGHFDVDTGEFEVFDFSSGQTGPYGIWPAPDGSLWVALFGTNRLGHIVTSDPPVLEEVELPSAGSRPRRLTVDSQGKVWYTDYPREKLGRFDPAAAEGMGVTEWDTSPQGGRGYGIALGPDGNVWFDNQDQTELVGFNPGTAEVVARLPRSDGSTGPVRNISVDMVRNRIWLAISNVGQMGVVQF